MYHRNEAKQPQRANNRLGRIFGTSGVCAFSSGKTKIKTELWQMETPRTNTQYYCTTLAAFPQHLHLWAYQTLFARMNMFRGRKTAPQVGGYEGCGVIRRPTSRGKKSTMKLKSTELSKTILGILSFTINEPLTGSNKGSDGSERLGWMSAFFLLLLIKSRAKNFHQMGNTTQGRAGKTFNLQLIYVQSWPKKFVLGCANAPMRQQAESCNLGHTFLANSVVVLKKTRHPIVQIRVQNYNHGFAEQRLSLCVS